MSNEDLFAFDFLVFNGKAPAHLTSKVYFTDIPRLLSFQVASEV